MTYDVVIVGGGHNALVAAAYLARAGKQVLVLERREYAGGAAVSEEPFPGTGALLSRYAYLVSLFPPRIADDLGIDLRLRPRAAVSYAPDGDVLVRPGEMSGELAAFSALAAPLERLFATFTEPLPTAAEARALVGDETWDALVERPLGEALAERLSDDVVRGMVGTDGVIGTFAALDDPSLAQNRCFLYHVVGGRWDVPAGGMGAVTRKLLDAALAAGAEVRCSAEVLAVDPASLEVTWTEGDEERAASASWVLAGVAPGVLARLLGEEAPELAEGAQMKVNLLLDRLPALRSGVDPELAFAGTFRLWERASELDAAFAAASRGDIPERPPAEMYCHTLTDPSIVRDGQHTLTLFGLHTPARLFAGDEAAVRDALVERYLDGLDSWLAEPIRDCIAVDASGGPCVEAKTPLDLERELGMPGGNIFHGALAWPWAEGNEGEGAGARWGVATAHDRLLLCGAGARRGGGVSGIGGHNAAMAILER
jgi:phytoene dehydrogenase-like protein